MSITQSYSRQVNPITNHTSTYFSSLISSNWRYFLERKSDGWDLTSENFTFISSRYCRFIFTIYNQLGKSGISLSRASIATILSPRLPKPQILPGPVPTNMDFRHCMCCQDCWAFSIDLGPDRRCKISYDTKNRPEDVPPEKGRSNLFVQEYDKLKNWPCEYRYTPKEIDLMRSNLFKEAHVTKEVASRVLEMVAISDKLGGISCNR